MYKKKIKTGETLNAWAYDDGLASGMSVGVYGGDPMIHIEEFGGKKQIVINKETAAKYGFAIVTDKNA